ncbi:MAG: hypothetical protein KC502_21480 [Myxococcales bacterium]|nr:hypothetical protein [Myxococcales bacterium]
MSDGSRIEGVIEADEVILGKGVVVEPGVVITGKGGPARKVVLGDYAYVGHDVRVLTPEFRLGDYSKLHMRGFLHGKKPLQIGRNCWIGGDCVLDSTAGLDIDDNVGIGASSQLWTHIQFGDIVEGSRFHSNKYMHVQKDAWFVGHCIVSPIEVGERAMALVGSVLTRDMLPNHIYGGSPAKDLTSKIGNQFAERTTGEKVVHLRQIIAEFEASHPEHAGMLQAAHDGGEIRDDERTWFDLSNRTYTQRYSAAEVAFLKAHVPLIKFTPRGAPAFIDLQR